MAQMRDFPVRGSRVNAACPRKERPKGTHLTTNTIRLALILSAALAFTGCGRTETTTESVQTATIAPANVPSSDTDAQLPTTQTTEIGEDRSPNEGGILNDQEAEPVSPTPSPSPQ